MRCSVTRWLEIICSKKMVCYIAASKIPSELGGRDIAYRFFEPDDLSNLFQNVD